MSTKVKIRKPYEKTERSSINFPEKTMTKQSFQQECDINTIMAKYAKDGVIAHVSRVQGAYGDFSNVEGYQLALNQVIAAQEAFDELPARVRERFGNDPANLMTFLQDVENRDEAIELGLIDKAAPEPPPQKVEIVEKKSAGAAPQTPSGQEPSKGS